MRASNNHPYEGLQQYAMAFSDSLHKYIGKKAKNTDWIDDECLGLGVKRRCDQYSCETRAFE